GQGGAGQGGAGQGGAGQGGAGQGGAGQAGAGQGGAGQAGAGGATPCVEGTYQCTMAGASLCMGGAWMPEVPCDFGCDAAGCQQCAIASDCVVDPCMTAACVQGKCQSTPMSDGTTCGPGQGNPQVCFGGACIDKCSGTGPLCVGRQPATCNLVTGLPLPQGAPCDIACSSGQCAAVAGLALGGDHSCLVTDQLSVWCWGENDLGQLGIGVTDGDAHHQPELSLAMGEKLAAGANHACVKDFDGVACWGDNGKGQLGAGITASPQTSPTPAVWAGSPPSPVQWIAAGQGFTIVQSSTDTWSAGDNSSQQFGVSTPPSSVSFEQLPLVSLSLQLGQAGRAHACALDSNSGLICWGDNSRGQLLLPASVSEGILQMPVAGPVTDLAVGGDNSCYLENGKLACAGDNSFGQLGVSPDSSPHEVAQTILAPGTQQWTRAVVGEGFVCATSSLGDVYCWGKNDVGQLGSDTGGTPSPMKQKVSLPFKPTLLAAGRDHVCAATTTAVSCWGGVTAGKLGRFGFSHDPGPVDFKP
ncbi:MAG: hypothetical protein IT374_07750, partial [Polyangiaceae bacterium]|nr:hypothetical protein [Polyangiaceae bacterium]